MLLKPKSKLTIFGAGPAGLYCAWRLATSGALGPGDRIELVEWGRYAFEEGDGGTRRPAGRICTHHFQDDVRSSYVEVGGMRYLEWDPTTHTGHQLVHRVIERLGLESEVIPFLTTEDPLLFLRGRAFYQDQLADGSVKAPYETPANDRPVGDLFARISALMTGDTPVRTRAEQCEFYRSGRLPPTTSSSVYRPGDIVSNLGYWNFFYDQAGQEGFNYAADAGGYSSNLINWNAADAAIYNGEFAPGGAFKTLETGFSELFVRLYSAAKGAAADRGIHFVLESGARLHSIWSEAGRPTYRLAAAETPFVPTEPRTTDVAILAMPPHSVELVARATRYAPMDGAIDFLNHRDVQNDLESVLCQPSLKVASFFDTPWWQTSKFPPKLVNASGDAGIVGPTITDLPLRQIYYFGDNSRAGGRPVHGMLVAYDDMRYTQFWRELHLPTDRRRETPIRQTDQPLRGAARATEVMERMLMAELASIHCGVADADAIPKPLETVTMDWGLPPFGAGYHAWAAHYDIARVMQTIRAPAKLAGAENNVFLVGSAFSNDQAWVEGAFCTAESVLVDFLGLTTIADTTHYPLICPCRP